MTKSDGFKKELMKLHIAIIDSFFVCVCTIYFIAINILCLTGIFYFK